MVQEYNAAREMDPAFKKRIDREQIVLLQAFQEELPSVIGVDMPDVPREQGWP
jgi:hypothetical protein